jgi:hypothetical protein
MLKFWLGLKHKGYIEHDFACGDCDWELSIGFLQEMSKASIHLLTFMTGKLELVAICHQLISCFSHALSTDLPFNS